MNVSLKIYESRFEKNVINYGSCEAAVNISDMVSDSNLYLMNRDQT